MKKRNLFIIIGGIILIGAVVAGTVLGVKAARTNKRNATTVVAFYDVPEEYIEPFTTTIQGETENKFEFITLEEADLFSDKFTQNVDILITYNSANTKELAEKAVPLSDNVLNRMPTTIKNSPYFQNQNKQPVIMPVVMDRFETTILKTTKTKYDIPWPEKTEDLEKFARTSKFYYPTPIIIAGAEDINVLSLLTQLVIAYGGKDGYENVKTQLANLTDFSKISDLKVGGDSESNLTINDLFDFIRNLQNQGFLASNWTKLSASDTGILIDDNRSAMSLMNLSEHRKKPMPNIYYYETVEFPVETAKSFASLQPVITALSFKDTEGTRITLNRLSIEDSQEYLSLVTKLGPAMLRGTSCDIQADDARYYAAATEAGPVPDLGTATLKTKEERHQLAEAIRNCF